MRRLGFISILLLLCLNGLAAGIDIPFTVENFTVADADGYFVQGGIPLPRGLAAPDTHFGVVDAQGNPVASDVRITAYWPDRSVKWVLVMMQPALDPEAILSYRLCSAPAAPAPDTIPLATQDDDRITVNTGPFQFTIPRAGTSLIESASLVREGKHTPVLREGSGLYTILGRKTADSEARLRFESNADAAAFSATLEDVSPLRAVILMKGNHSNASGETVLPYTLRLYAYRNATAVRFVHTVILDREPRQEFIRAIGLQLNLADAAWEGYSFGGDQGAGIYTRYTETDYEPIWQRAVLSQDSAQHFSVHKWVDPVANSPINVADGHRSQGWCAIQTDTFQVVTGIKNFWQEYPKSIAVDAKARRIDVQVYSEHGAPLDLRRYSDLGYHGLYEAGAAKPGTPATPFNHDVYNAINIAKTSEFFLEFAPGHPEKTHAAKQALLFQRPPLLRPDMEWIASSKALGTFATADASPAFSLAAERLNECITHYQHEQEARNWYSFIDYGDVRHSFDTARDEWCFDRGGYAWMNNEGQFCGSTWMAYLFTGDESVYRFAEAMTKHSQDIDMYHQGKRSGHGMRHNVNHWGCVDRERRMTIPFNKRVYYYLSGDEATRDRMLFIYEHLAKNAGHYAAMDFSVGGMALLYLWESTGDPQYGDALKTLTETFCSQRIDGYGFPAQLNLDFVTGEGSIKENMTMLPYFFLVYFGPMRLLMESSELTESVIVKDAVLNWATLLLMPPEEAAKKQVSYPASKVAIVTNMEIAAYAYRHTGDTRYREYIHQGLTSPDVYFEEVGGTGQLDAPRHKIIRTTEAPTGERERFQSNTAAVMMYNYPFGFGALHPVKE